MRQASVSNSVLADPQADPDVHGIPLDLVGLRGVLYPVWISGWENDPTHAEQKEALFSLKVSLASDQRGIHMSRLLETLHHWKEPLSPATLPTFLRAMRQRQHAQHAAMTVQFNWLISRPAPQTGCPAWQGIETTWHGTQDENSTTVAYTLRIPVTTLCPCSRAISDYGAHSQRSWIRVKIEWPTTHAIVALREIFEKLQHAGSAPIYPLLKRTDERHVTMLAYEQPAFV